MASLNIDLPRLYPVTEEEIRILTDEALHPPRTTTMKGSKATALLTASYQTPKSLSARDQEQQALSRVLHAIYQDTTLHHLPPLSIALAIFNDLDRALFCSTLQENIVLMDAPHFVRDKVRRQAASRNYRLRAITIPRNMWYHRVAIALGSVHCTEHGEPCTDVDCPMPCWDHGRPCASDACRAERLLLTLIHEMVHAFLEVVCGKGIDQDKENHGVSFREVLGVVQCRLTDGGCTLDLGQGGKYAIVWPGEGGKAEGSGCCGVM